jgi:hypothetical protein
MSNENSFDAQEAPGLPPPEAYRLQIAIHEAGHVVTFIRLGVDFGLATIVPTEDCAGTTRSHVKAWDKEDAQAKAIGSCAGYAACVAAGYAEERAALGCVSDFDETDDLIEFWGLAPLSTHKAEAVELMCLPENKRAVTLISQHLLLYDTLDEDYMIVLVEVADGLTTEAEFDQYLRLRRWPDRR